MSAGMADIIAAHILNESAGCLCGGSWWLTHPTHAAHLAEELAKAGYGNMQAAKAEAWENGKLSYFETTLTGQPICANPYLPDPLAAALADPEGHALVKAIHDRKAEGAPDHTTWCRGNNHEGPCRRGRSSGTEESAIHDRKAEARDLLGIAPHWTDGKSTDEYMDEQRSR